MFAKVRSVWQNIGSTAIAPPTTTDANVSDHDTDWIVTLLGAIGVGLIVVAALGLTNGQFGRGAAFLGGLLLAGGSGLSGGFFGFLFGIPRSKQVQTPVTSESGTAGREYLENTNLEQISDWLTKIIVGLTLVQFQQIQAFVGKVGEKFGPILITSSDNSGPQAVAIAMLLYFFITGFLFSYLWTRIYMESLLRRQHALLTSEIDRIFDVRQEQQTNADATALELVEEFLDKNVDPSAAKFKNIKDEVASASLIARTMIFRKARNTRRRNWREDGIRELIDRTVPVFRGLIAAAPDRYHRNYGQLGYALVKMREPDWIRAKEALEKAIELRGPLKDSGSGYYEYNLALAIINTDAEFHNGEVSQASTKTRLTNLLDIGTGVIKDPDDPEIVRWAELNGYELKGRTDT